jgi:hypothetical protein
MARRVRDPYQVLGVSPDVSDAALRSAYHKLVQLHHPDHNAGSPAAARRFEEVQDAYAQITRLRRTAAGPRPSEAPPTTAPPNPEVDSRMADLERQVREAHQARERARRAAAEAAARTEKRPSDEELGYVRTDDTFSKLLDDVRTELSEKFAQARTHPARERVADLIDELAAKLRRDPPER